MIMRYEFHIAKNDDGTCRFELDGIKLILEDFKLKGEKHWITNPERAIAYFLYNDNHLYGVANNLKTFNTVEDFYEVMKKQYAIFKGKLAS